MQIAFWSPVHGQTATTTAMVAVAGALALTTTNKILLTHNHHRFSALETSFLERRKYREGSMQLNDQGIDALSRFIRHNQPQQDSIRRYITPILKDRLDLLAGTQQVSRDIFMKDQDTTFLSVLDQADRFYDMTLVDVAAGENPLSMKILEHADMIVILLNQNGGLLDEFFETDMAFPDKSMFLISFYDPQSKYHLKNIRRKYKLSLPIGAIPYCRPFADAMGDGMALEHMMRHVSGKKGEESFFIQEVKRSAQLIAAAAVQRMPREEGRSYGT